MKLAVDVLVIGGGAAGLMCALTAGQRGRKVLVLEHANRVGKKILMSGGGRCNFTNTGTTPANFISANPHFCKSALARYQPADFLALVEKHRIGWHEKELGQLFCNDSSKQIVQLLLDECAAANVRIETSCSLQQAQHRDSHWSVTCTLGQVSAAALVVATGGLSVPTMGATGLGHDLARQFGHTVLPLRAGLVPLTLSGSHQQHYADLSGLALPISAQVGKQRFNNAMLFTHRGLSGPAILQISSYWQPGEKLRLNLLPGLDTFDWLQQAQARHGARELKTVLAEKLADWPIVPSGTEGYRTAEVTLGGVDTRDISSTSMESRLQPGLFFIGEVVDVSGHLGGYNFQWAWASGRAAGGVV